jgi:5-methylcytosine-specific restriction endonuclease McrA
MARAALGWLAGATGLTVAEQADCLRGLESMEAAHTAARSAVLSSFASAHGPESDGHGSVRSWLRWQTRVTTGAASGAIAWARRLAAHQQLRDALAAGQLSTSWARHLCAWIDELPEDARPAAESILLAAAVDGADLAGLAALAEEIRRRTAGPDTDNDDDGFARRGLRLGVTFRGAGRLEANLSATCTAALSAVLDTLGKPAGPEETRTRSQRHHDALEEACRRLLASGGVPDRAGQPTQIQLHMTLGQLLNLPGAPEAEAAWASRWPTPPPGAACDATIVPVVSGHLDPSALDDLVTRLLGQISPVDSPATAGSPPAPGPFTRQHHSPLGQGPGGRSPGGRSPAPNGPACGSPPGQPGPKSGRVPSTARPEGPSLPDCAGSAVPDPEADLAGSPPRPLAIPPAHNDTILKPDAAGPTLGRGASQACSDEAWSLDAGGPVHESGASRSGRDEILSSGAANLASHSPPACRGAAGRLDALDLARESSGSHAGRADVLNAGGEGLARAARARRAAEVLILARAVRLLSGPGGLASYLRTHVTTGPAASISLPLDTGAATPTIPPHLRRMVITRDRHCRFPGCTQLPAACHIHHLTPRAHGGATDLPNLILLCAFHHLTAIHRWGWQLTLHPDGTTTATSPDHARTYRSHTSPAPTTAPSGRLARTGS